MLEPVKSDVLASFADSGIAHGFYTRRGGVSTGLYESLNTGIGSSDNSEDVTENRARIAADLGVKALHLAGCRQIHSADVVTVTGPLTGNRPEADGLVTNVRGIGLAILTADCGPVLFADNTNQIIGACHAGWKGAFTGIAENTIERMLALGAARENITAVLGPCISRKNYEVGPEFKARFDNKDPALSAYFTASQKPDHYMFDLQGYILDRLKAVGVQAHKTGHCTYEDRERFFSYRRTTHKNEPDYGRQMSAIALI